MVAQEEADTAEMADLQVPQHNGPPVVAVADTAEMAEMAEETPEEPVEAEVLAEMEEVRLVAVADMAAMVEAYLVLMMVPPELEGEEAAEPIIMTTPVVPAAPVLLPFGIT